MTYQDDTYSHTLFERFFFEKNLQGDIVAVYNEFGKKIGSYYYDAWGNHTVVTESGNNWFEDEIVNNYNPFRYRGYYYDIETGFYYLQSRYYNPEWGRFLNPDVYVSTGQGLLGNNMYAYCNNNPIMFVDREGKFLEDFFAGVEAVLDVGRDAVRYLFVDVPTAVCDAIFLDAGVGSGLGASLEADGFSFTWINRYDYITIRKDAGDNSRLYRGKASDDYFAFEGLKTFWGRGKRKFYDKSGEEMYSTDVAPCFDFTTSVGASGYLFFGLTFEIGIDWEYLINRMGGYN